MHQILISQSVQSQFAASKLLTGALDEPVVSARSPDNQPRFWRVTLQKVVRQDNKAPIVEGSVGNTTDDNVVQFPSQQFQYAIGYQNTPRYPPQRSNPVDGGGAGLQVLAQIAWGMSNAAPARIAAQWPMQGGSVVVYGTAVDVFATASCEDLTVYQQSRDQQAKVTATIVPHEGPVTADDCELSIQQLVPVLPYVATASPTATGKWGGAVYVPDYARRVKVILTEDLSAVLPGNTRAAPFVDLPCVLTWFDDNGIVMDSSTQGAFQFASGGVVTGGMWQAVVWHPIPAGATMLQIRGQEEYNGSALVHWRIAP